MPEMTLSAGPCEEFARRRIRGRAAGFQIVDSQTVEPPGDREAGVHAEIDFPPLRVVAERVIERRDSHDATSCRTAWRPCARAAKSTANRFGLRTSLRSASGTWCSKDRKSVV